MKKIVWLLVMLGWLGMPSRGLAQSDSYQLRYYAPGATAPLQSSDIWTTAEIVCNQVPPTVTNSVNPTRVIWDDPANAGRVCIYTVPSVGKTLYSLPVGSYEGTLALTNAAGEGAESARAPFSRAAVPGVLTGVRLVR